MTCNIVLLKNIALPNRKPTIGGLGLTDVSDNFLITIQIKRENKAKI
jgi:hypothetical protein